MAFFGLGGTLTVADEIDGEGDVEIMCADDGEIIIDYLTREELQRLIAHLESLLGYAN